MASIALVLMVLIAKALRWATLYRLIVTGHPREIFATYHFLKAQLTKEKMLPIMVTDLAVAVVIGGALA